MARRFLYLIRHGQYLTTTFPPNDPDGALTGKGKEQVRLLADRLRIVPISVIHHSTLMRATETAQLIAQQLPKAVLHPSDLLRETIPCVPEQFKDHFVSFTPKVLEHGKIQAPQAFDTFFKPLVDAAEDQYEVLVSHGNLIGYFVARTLLAPCDSWVRADIQLCGLSVVSINTGGLTKLESHNDVGHLPQALLDLG